MSQVSDQDVAAIKEWLAKEPHLPKTFDDLVLKKFIFSCHCSLERTKKCIDDFCTKRVTMPEIFTKRDTLSKKIQRVFSTTNVTVYMDNKNEIIIHKLKEFTSDFDFYDVLSTFSLQLDQWITIKLDVLPENQIAIIDIGAYTLKLISHVNIFFFKGFVSFLLECVPLRLKEVHFINCPSFYEYMYKLVKPAFPEYLCKMFHFHPDHTTLYKFITKEALPKEYGGESQSMEEQNEHWINRLMEDRNIYLNDNLWKADLKLKVKNDSCDNSMNGSFKTLEFD